MDASNIRAPAPHRWAAPEIADELRPGLMTRYVREIENRQSDIAQRMYRNAYLYTGEQISGVNVQWRVRPYTRPDIARINMTESLIETAYARIASRKPRLASITRGGDWKLRQRARGLDQFLEGVRFTSKADDAIQRVFRDAVALGTGVGKVYPSNGQILTDRVFPLEIIVDELAALTTPPRQMFQRRFVDVDEAVAEFEGAYEGVEDDLWRASSSSSATWTNYLTYESYQVPIIEGVRLPSRPGAGDGVRMVATETKILALEEWTYDYFPWFAVQWTENLMGWYGRGLPEVVYWMQARLNRHAAGLLERGGPVVLAGDYNVIPTDLDADKPGRWADDALFLPETREAYRRLLAQGWTDALRALHPDEKIYTFWDYFRGAFARDAGIRIDHLLLSPGLAPRLRAAGVDRDVRALEKTSDHAPAWIEVEG